MPVMASSHCTVFLAVATSAVVVSAGACTSFSAEDTAHDDAGTEASPAETGADTARDANSCPTAVVFSDTFDANFPDRTVWTPTLHGSGAISTTMPGQYVASVTKTSGDVALIDARFTLPHPSKLVCITLRAGLVADAATFKGGYVATMQNDLRANKNDVGHAFIGLGMDKGGVFTNIKDDGGPAQIGRPAMSTTSSALSTVIYRIESNGMSSVVTILVDGAVQDQRTLALLPQVADLDLDFGASTSDTSGAFGPVTFTLDSVVVTAE